MGAPKDPEKRKLWIERKSGKNNPMFGTKRPDFALWCRQHSGEKSPNFGTKRPEHSERMSGENNPMYDKHHTEETKQKQSKIKIGKYTGENNPLFGRTGESSPNFGRRKENPTTPLHQLIRNCFKYRQWRDDIYTRDDFTCQNCNKRGGYLHAHHNKKWFSIILKENSITTLKQAENCAEIWSLNNGLTLCKKCHKKLHKKLKKEQ